MCVACVYILYRFAVNTLPNRLIYVVGRGSSPILTENVTIMNDYAILDNILVVGDLYKVVSSVCPRL